MYKFTIICLILFYDISRELLAAFQKDDIVSAKEILTKLKYYSSIDSKLKEIKQNLGIPD